MRERTRVMYREREREREREKGREADRRLEVTREREREREREAELTRHGNGKWDATEYRWTLTGMRVRITGCHPYSAGLAAVSGQCHRYISIITFAIATAGCIPMHALRRTALCGRPVAYLFRRPICICRYANARHPLASHPPRRSPSFRSCLALFFAYDCRALRREFRLYDRQGGRDGEVGV